MGLKSNSNSGFAIRKLGFVRWASASSLAFGGCDAGWKPRSKGLRFSNGAQARVPVPLKGEDKSKRAGPANTIGTRTARRMPTLQGREPKGECADRRVVVVVSVFDFSSFFTLQGSMASVSQVGWKFDWSFVQNKDRSINPRRGKRRRGYLIKERMARR
jgi:hypothetical protein